MRSVDRLSMGLKSDQIVVFVFFVMADELCGVVDARQLRKGMSYDLADMLMKSIRML